MDWIQIMFGLGWIISIVVAFYCGRFSWIRFEFALVWTLNPPKRRFHAGDIVRRPKMIVASRLCKPGASRSNDITRPSDWDGN